MAALHFELVTPERLVRSEEVYMVTVPGSEGDFGALHGLAPMMTALKPDAALSVFNTEGAAPETIRVQGGFAEVSATGLTVLAEAIIS
ncbi:MAG: ATP synthase F1 subunit epsilon [Alphaproteobacteria bacterium]|nr:ATP synthase F1 subunit epsilon [Alphaproteobacteria bacterium]MDE2341667.1 ATP synthase F1 subunit epsilon [Alphaproteobacteria bacterium]